MVHSTRNSLPAIHLARFGGELELPVNVGGSYALEVETSEPIKTPRLTSTIDTSRLELRQFGETSTVIINIIQQNELEVTNCVDSTSENVSSGSKFAAGCQTIAASPQQQQQQSAIKWNWRTIGRCIGNSICALVKGVRRKIIAILFFIITLLD